MAITQLSSTRDTTIVGWLLCAPPPPSTRKEQQLFFDVSLQHTLQYSMIGSQGLQCQRADGSSFRYLSHGVHTGHMNRNMHILYSHTEDKRQAVQRDSGAAGGGGTERSTH
ncbi:unnamed protein product [Arctogadus glacialis]